jgi:hypothetical protein
MKKYISLLFLLIFASSVYGAEVPKYEEYIVRADVSLDTARGIYKYNYTLINPSSNRNPLGMLDIYIPRDPKGKELSWDGLTYGKGYLLYTSELHKDKAIPVGLDGPNRWIYGIGEDENGKGFAIWGNMEEESRIYPGGSLSGLIMTSYGLPGIREATIMPHIDYDNLPEEYYENVELTKQLEDSLEYHTKTIGPTAPPADFKPLDFLNYIIDLKHQAFSLGWIKERGIEESLDAKLENARKKIEEGNTVAAKNILEALINEVEAQGCESYENCPSGKHLTSEAYALLKYNVRYLIENL